MQSGQLSAIISFSVPVVWQTMRNRWADHFYKKMWGFNEGLNRARCMLSPNKTPIACVSHPAHNSPHMCLLAPTPPLLWDVGCSVKLKGGCWHELPDDIAVYGLMSHFAL